MILGWNMQGKGTSGEATAKWDKIRAWFDDPQNARFHYAALQEVGVVPGTGASVIPGIWTVEDQRADGFEVKLLKWQKDGVDLWVVYSDLELSSGATNRCNLAIVSRRKPADFTITTSIEKADPDGLPAFTRPAIGALFETGGQPAKKKLLYSVHASAKQGWDAPNLLESISLDALAFSHAHGDRLPWVAVGDYNRERVSLFGSPVLARVVRDTGFGIVQLATGHREATHPRVFRFGDPRPLRKIDYAYMTHGIEVTKAERFDMGYSDHFAVLYTMSNEVLDLSRIFERASRSVQRGRRRSQRGVARRRR